MGNERRNSRQTALAVVRVDVLAVLIVVLNLFCLASSTPDRVIRNSMIDDRCATAAGKRTEMSSKLTSHLLSLETTPTYSAATQHIFLTLAGRGDLPLTRLALWLSQDRIYAAHAYPRFIGALISRIPFHESDPIDGTEEQFKQGILHLLVKCLDNIVLEVEFFKKTAAEFQLDVDEWMERKGTRDYTAEMARISLTSSLEEGIVFLWAMEKVYFDAWSYVKRLLEEQPHHLAVKSSSPATEKFATNWSSPEFGVFVETLANLVDKLDIKPGTDLWRRVESTWTRVIELEVGFWPNDGEEDLMKKNK